MLLFTAFYVDVPGPSRAREYLDYMLVGEKALTALTPNSRYVVLTDRATAKRIDKRIETAVVAPDDGPLMVKFIAAQMEFERRATHGMTVLAGSDCIPNADLNHSMPSEHGLGVTYRSDNFKINNVGFVRDHDLAAWFLSRSLAILTGYPGAKQEWFGDQESWEEALCWDTASLSAQDDGDKIYSTSPEGREIHLYPSMTHNCPVHRKGKHKGVHRRAFILHFKGTRKRMLDRYVAEHVL